MVALINTTIGTKKLEIFGLEDGDYVTICPSGDSIEGDLIARSENDHYVLAINSQFRLFL